MGKTRLASALIAAWRLAGQGAVGWKPVESGVVDAPHGEGEDERALREAAGLVTSPAPTVRLRRPLSPHLAARYDRVDLGAVPWLDRLAAVQATAPIAVIELAGGLCSPFDDDRDNLDWLASWPPALAAERRLLLVAKDQLGVLHDVGAAVRAAAGCGLGPAAVALVAPVVADESTGTNLAALRERAGGRWPCLTVPRLSVMALAEQGALAPLLGVLGQHPA